MERTRRTNQDGNVLGDDKLWNDKATCEDVRAIVDNARAAFPGVPVTLIGPCVECYKDFGAGDEQTLTFDPLDPPIR